MKSAIELISLVGKPEFTKQMVLLPVWEKVRPKPRKHKLEGRKCFKCRGVIPIDYNCPIPEKAIAPCPVPDPFTGSLAELAFELRDKADEYIYKSTATWEVYSRIVIPNKGYTEGMFWFTNKATPYHWIIAALLAIEMESEK